MKPLGSHNYFVYILTNVRKTVLYTGITNDLRTRIEEHKVNSLTKKNTFAGKYNCYFLIYYENFRYINHAISREKEIKGWTRNKKQMLILEFNPEWRFLNDEIE